MTVNTKRIMHRWKLPWPRNPG